MWWSRLFTRKKKEEHRPTDTESWMGRLNTSDAELVMVIGPEDDDCVCGDWIGAVLSVSGMDGEYPSLASAVEDGLLHPRCRHTLATYDPNTASIQKAEKVIASTRRAIAAMTARANGEGNTLPLRYTICSQKDEDVGYSPPAAVVKFERVYKSARQADLDSNFQLAEEKCKAALDILSNEDIYGKEQGKIILILEARLNKLQQQTSNA